MNAKVALIGEGPGKNEDEKGEPFTGDAGQYLNSLLRSIGIAREDCLISNCVKCRPKGNRTPTREEARFCGQRWLDLELSLVKPEIIVPMGKVAIEYFLGEGLTVEHVHGIPILKDGPTWKIASGQRLTQQGIVGSGRPEDSHSDMGPSSTGERQENYERPIGLPGRLPMAPSQQGSGSSTDVTTHLALDQHTSTSEAIPTTCTTPLMPRLTERHEKLTVLKATPTMEVTQPTEKGEEMAQTESEYVESVSGGGTELDGLQGVKSEPRVVLLPVFHPAAGFYNTSLMREIQSDFKVLGGLVAGKSVEDFQRVDQYSEPSYRQLPEGENIEPFDWALDTETVDGKLWSVQTSCHPGTGLFMFPDKWEQEAEKVSQSRVTVHNYLYDAQFLSLPKNTDDTMLMAYLLGLPQGLKELAWRFCGMEMESYTETVSPYRKEKALNYLNTAISLKPGMPVEFETTEEKRKFLATWACIGSGGWFYKDKEPPCMDTGAILPVNQEDLGKTLTLLKKTAYGAHKVKKERVEKGVYKYRLEGNDWSPDQVAWPSPPILEDMTWSKTRGKLEVKRTTPHHITRKMKGIVADVVGGKVLESGPVDAHNRWYSLDPREREEVEAVMGMMPDGTMDDIPREKAVYYASRDADATGRVRSVLWPMIQEAGLQFTYEMDKATLPVALEMMQRGFKVDPDYLRMLSRSFLERMERQAEIIFDTANLACPECWGTASTPAHTNPEACRCRGSGKFRFNPNSDNELRVLFFERLGFKPSRYTETGLPSVAKGELAKIKHPVVPEVELYRHLTHLRDSFCETLPAAVDENNRIHGEIKVTRTATGRWSMADFNSMQIPARSEDGRLIRKGYICEPGNVLLSADYSQIEMRIVAHLSKCESMIRLFREGRHIHKETMSEIFGIPLDDVDSNSVEYKATKNIGFGVIYLESEYGLETQMAREGADGWDLDRCRDFIKNYYQLRPELKTYQEGVKSFARLNGYVQDLVGRVRFTPEVQSPIRRIRAAGERQACNMPVQSSAQAVIKLAMGKLHRSSPAFLWWLLQVHDELVWECPKMVVDGMAKWVVGVMENVVRISVPITVEVKAGPNWLEMDKI